MPLTAVLSLVYIVFDFSLLRLLCTCCWALRPCTIPLNDLNEALLYKGTIDYDSFKYLVEPLFNTPTLERRTAPSFGTWLTGAQYIVTQMERVRIRTAYTTEVVNSLRF